MRPTAPVVAAWQRDWTVVVMVSTTTPDGTPLSDSVPWAADRQAAAARVWGVADAWAQRFVGLELTAGGVRWIVDSAASCYRPDAVEDTACWLHLVPTDATGAQPLEEDALGAALAGAVITASGHHQRLEYEGDAYAGELSADAEAFYDADRLMSGSLTPAPGGMVLLLAVLLLLCFGVVVMRLLIRLF
jgi:hypothetical protein